MKRRLFSIIAVLVTMLLALSISVAAADSPVVASGRCGDKLTWKLDQEGTVTISGTGAMYDNFYTFSDWVSVQEKVNRLVMEDGITVVSRNSFLGCNNLTEIVFPSSIKEVRENAFDMHNNNNIKIHIPNLSAWFNISFFGPWSSPLGISGHSALYINNEPIECALYIPEGTTQIGYNSAWFSNIYRAVIPQSATALEAAFEGCYFLEEIVFLGNAPEIALTSFQNLELTAYYPKNNATWTSDVLKDYQGDITWLPYEEVGTFGIVAQPSSCVARIDTYASFHVLAIGDSLTYQWQQRKENETKWTNISGLQHNPATLAVNVSEYMNNTSYRCIIKDAGGNTITSNTAVLSLDMTVCYDYSVDRVNDTIRYLNDIYIEKYPDLGLRFLYGDSREKAMLQDLADVITEGCNTDAEKAQAIANWVKRNIEYESLYFIYPNNAFFDRKGNCMEYALLMQTLFRLENIPAVWGGGWRGNMKEVIPETLYNMDGHAWCWAYIDGQWTLFDPLWLDKGTVDKQYMASWIYMNNIEGIYPFYGDEFPPTVGPVNCYNGSKFLLYENGKPNATSSGLTISINYKLHLHTITRRFSEGGFNDGTDYLDPTKDRNELINGEFYRNGWLTGYKFVYENGIRAVGTILSLENQTYYMDSETGEGFAINIPASEYFLINGQFSVKTGYQGKPLEMTTHRSLKWPVYTPKDYTITWKSADETIATVREDGYIKALREGTVRIAYSIVRNSDNARMSAGGYTLRILDNTPAPDYSDNYPIAHEHTYTTIVRKPTCYMKGYTIHTCTFESCAHSYRDSYTEIINHTEVTDKAVAATCTTDGKTEGKHCSVCNAVTVKQNTVAKLGHKWDNGKVTKTPTAEKAGEKTFTCTVCKTTKTEEIPALGVCDGGKTCPLQKFSDVKTTHWAHPGMDFAVNNGLMNGTGDGSTFEPNTNMSRAMLVTVLWRYSGSPEAPDCNFTDVASTAWYYKAVAWAASEGVVNGVGDGTSFDPNGNVTREMMATILYRYAKMTGVDVSASASISGYPDAKSVASWSSDPVKWAVAEGIISGAVKDGKTVLAPQDSANRAVVATIMMRFIQNVVEQ